MQIRELTRHRKIKLLSLLAVALLLTQCTGAGYWPLTYCGIEAMRTHVEQVEAFGLDGPLANALVRYDDGSRVILRYGVLSETGAPTPGTQPDLARQVPSEAPLPEWFGEPQVVHQDGEPAPEPTDEPITVIDMREFLVIRRYDPERSPPGIAAPRTFESQYHALPPGPVAWNRARTWGTSVTIPFRAAIDLVVLPFRVIATLFVLRALPA